MFNLFGKKRNECPISEDTRIWMENAFIWLINQFGEDTVINQKTLVLSKENFPINYTNSEDSAYDILKIVSNQMDIDPSKIELFFYENPTLEIQNGGFTLNSVTEDETSASGIYEGKNSSGKFTIYIEWNELKDLENLVAIFAHEIGHIRILGEGRLEENDEYLTDLITVFFGLGIFNANASFKSYNSQEQWQYKKLGYFSQQEWGYALSLYAYVRNETSPIWLNFLRPNIKSDFAKSYSYILDNQDKVLV